MHSVYLAGLGGEGGSQNEHGTPRQRALTMAVLIEAISVVIRMDRLTPFGSWEAFRNIVPNTTLCADTELVRVGFTSPAEVRKFVEVLESYGLKFSETGPAEDIVICDQQKGFTTHCAWAEFGFIDLDNDPKKRTAAARLSDSSVNTIATPIGWSWDQSLTRDFIFWEDGSAN